jgi:hypothetical protein
MLRFVPLIALLGVFLWHLGLIVHNQVDILNMDEWVVWWTWGEGSQLGWIAAPYNEFLLVPTKALILFCEKFLGGDSRYLVTVNFFLYGMIPGWFLWFARARVPEIAPAWLAAFGIFFLSPVAYENHSMAMESCFHFSLLFPLLAVGLLFRKDQSTGGMVGSFALLLMAIGSSAAGAAAAVAIVGVYFLFALSDARHRKAAGTLLAGTLLALALWSIVRKMPGETTTVTLPWTKRFWDFFLNAVNTGFGFDRESTLIGGICLLIVLAPVVALLGRGRRASLQDWAAVALVAAALSICIALTLARAWSAIGASKTSRYREYEMLLLFTTPLTYALWLKHSRWKQGMLAGLLAVCVFAYADNWSTEEYDTMRTNREVGRACVRDYLHQRGDGTCATIFPVSLVPFIQRGRALNSPLLHRLERE